MNSQSPTTSSEQASPQPETLYGNGQFLVRLWSISPGQQVCFKSNEGLRCRQLFLIAGKLNAHGQNLPDALPTAQRVEVPGNIPDWTLLNTGTQNATLLEIAQGEQLTQVPLPAVTEIRPWGSFTILKDEPDYKLKQLINTPGNRLSLQRHQKREEHWLITAGHPEITLDEGTHHLQPGDYIHIPLHSWHRLSNPAQNTDAVELIELQLGDYFGEDDIERRQDDYGRT